MVLRRLCAALAVLALTAAAAVGAPGLRTATPADDGAHPGAGDRTEWWFVSATDPERGFSVAAALGSTFPGNPPATVVFLYLPDGAVHTVAAARVLDGEPATDRADVRLGPDRLWSPRPGVTRVRIDMPTGIPLFGGSPGPVSLDLTLRATNPGFTAGPLALPEGQDLSWTVGAPAARVDGVVRVDGRTFRLDGARGYHDHNYGEFDLADDAHGGWDWSAIHLPGGRSLVSGIVRPADPFPRDGVLVLSDADGRLGSARAEDVADPPRADGRASASTRTRARCCSRPGSPAAGARRCATAPGGPRPSASGSTVRAPWSRWRRAPPACCGATGRSSPGGRTPPASTSTSPRR